MKPGTKVVQLVEGGHLFHADPLDRREPDAWRYDADYHNGPACAECYECWCEHCEPNRYEEQCHMQEEAGLFDEELGGADILRRWKEPA